MEENVFNGLLSFFLVVSGLCFVYVSYGLFSVLLVLFFSFVLVFVLGLLLQRKETVNGLVSDYLKVKFYFLEFFKVLRLVS